jgi:hypothetical protein
MKKIFTSLCLMILLTACNTDDANLDLFPAGTDYFPLTIGNFVVYNVKETNYFLNEPRKTEATYQLKEVIKESYKDLANNTTYRIERYKRNNGRDNWVLWNIWTARVDYKAAVRTEDNFSAIKLVFPLENGKKWNPNTFNTSNTTTPNTYQMLDLGKSFSFAGKSYAETITVSQSNDSTLVGKDKRMEIYAKDIGMIYKKIDVLVYCQFENCRGKAEIERGNVMEMSVFDYGKE